MTNVNNLGVFSLRIYSFESVSFSEFFANSFQGITVVDADLDESWFPWQQSVTVTLRHTVFTHILRHGQVCWTSVKVGRSLSVKVARFSSGFHHNTIIAYTFQRS